jgi:hypothetical protein
MLRGTSGVKEEELDDEASEGAAEKERRRADSNRRMEVLQTSALPLGYGASY